MGVLWDARIESRPLFPCGVAVSGIVARDRGTPDIQAAHCDSFINQQDRIRDHGAASRVLLKNAVMVSGNDNLVAMGQFSEPSIEVFNLRCMVPKGEVARMN